VALAGLAGSWGLALAVARRPVTVVSRWVFGAGAGAMLLEVALGLILLQQGKEPGDDFHVFYGIVIVITFAFAYIFRTQIARRPAVTWGLMLLFVMGLGLRAWANAGG
jgi:hypothetical protein